jgi:serine/threonine-protein kinase
MPGDGRQPLLIDELQVLLRTRLRGFAAFALAGFVLALVLSYWEPISAFRREHPPFVALPAFVALMVGLNVLLYRWSTTMRRLRLLEVALFAVVSLQFALAMYDAFQHRARFAIEDAHQATIYSVMGDVHVLRWFALIAAYGTLIPNTGRYNTGIVLGMAATPFAVFALLCAQDAGACEMIVTSVLWHALFWIPCGVALSIYGAHKLRVLREAVFDTKRMGQYTLERLLGTGGAGAVYLARHRRLRRPCAVKIIRPEKAGDRTAQLRFEHEVQAMAELNHPNCVEIYDYGRADDGALFYAMEYLEGMNLWDMVQQHGALPAGRTITVLQQIGAALEAAHGRGLVHRDVKPRNIFIGYREGLGDVAKLLDFGLVQVDALYDANQDRATLEGKTVGTPWFMSPEQIVAHGKLDGRSDLYSLGATAYYLLTGELPFDRPNVIDVFSAHLHEPPVPLTRIDDNLPVDLQEVVLHCLEKKPADRFPDAAALTRALAACRDAHRWNAEEAQAWWKKQHVPALTYH